MGREPAFSRSHGRISVQFPVGSVPETAGSDPLLK